MNTLLKILAIGLNLIAGSQAMETECMNQIPQEQKTKELTATEKDNAHKMMLMKQFFEDMAKEEVKEEVRLPEVPKDVQNVIGGKLHNVSANPVLDGKLEYTMDNGEKKQFKIMDLVKEDGSIDLSNKEVFGDSSQYLLITTAPEAFFRIVENGQRLVILIAPKFLIDEIIGSSLSTFQAIMANWKEVHAPIGIFYRRECWNDLRRYNYLTSANLISISKNNLYENSKQTTKKEVVYCTSDVLQKISCLF